MPLSLSDDTGPGFCCEDLLCGEDAGGVLAEDPAAVYSFVTELPEDSDESIAVFVEGESEYSPGLDYPDRFRSSSLDPLARADAVSWILKVHSYYRFHPLTAYLSVNYMDRFLSSHGLPQANGWPLQLLVVTCLSLAAKMEETLVPSLLDLQIEDARFIFEPRTISKMEFLVLTALNWRLRSVTPFTFMNFFADKADPSGAYTKYLISRATQIILATTRDVEFVNHCPSSIAAAAIIYAAGETGDLAFIDPGTTLKWCIGLSQEGITNCYELMHEVASHGVDGKPPRILPQLRVTNTMSMASGTSSSTTAQPNKRRRLSGKCSWVDGDKEEE